MDGCFGAAWPKIKRFFHSIHEREGNSSNQYELSKNFVFRNNQQETVSTFTVCFLYNHIHKALTLWERTREAKERRREIEREEEEEGGKDNTWKWIDKQVWHAKIWGRRFKTKDQLIYFSYLLFSEMKDVKRDCWSFLSAESRGKISRRLLSLAMITKAILQSSRVFCRDRETLGTLKMTFIKRRSDSTGTNEIGSIFVEIIMTHCL